MLADTRKRKVINTCIYINPPGDLYMDNMLCHVTAVDNVVGRTDIIQSDGSRQGLKRLRPCLGKWPTTNGSSENVNKTSKAFL